MWAACLLAAWGRETETEAEENRALVGAITTAQAVHDLGLIRKALAKEK